MIQLFSKFIAIGLVYLIAFFAISFLINVIALRIGGKSAKAETGTWTNALKAATLMFLASLLFSGLGSFLQTLSLTTQSDPMRQAYSGLAALLGLASIAANIYIIMKVFVLNGGETVKAVLIAILVGILLNGILIAVFVGLFFGTFFKMAVQTIPDHSPVAAADTSRPKLPKLPSPETAQGEAKDELNACQNEQDCNPIDEFCFKGLCQKADDITKKYGPPCDLPCPNCVSGSQQENYITRSLPNPIQATYCVECFLSGMFDCKKGTTCIDEKCVGTPTVSNPQAPTPATAADPESLKRDDERIAKMNETLAGTKAASPADLTSMRSDASATPCQPTNGFPFQPKNFTFGTKSCDTTYFKNLPDGFIMLIGVENASKANLDTRRLPPTPPSSVNDILTLLGPVSDDTPNQNQVYAVVFEQSMPAEQAAQAKTESTPRANSVAIAADLNNLSMSLELYASEKGQYPDAPIDHCLTPTSATYQAILPYWQSKFLKPLPPSTTLTAKCEGSFYYKTFDLNGNKNGAYVLAADTDFKEANFELPTSLDDSLFTSPDNIKAKIGSLTQESVNPLQSIYVMIP
jgi:hypothetical protein